VALGGLSPQADAAELTIDSWFLMARAITSPNGYDDDVSYAPVSPFQDTHYAAADSSWAQADYDSEYAQSFGRFLIGVSHSALGGPFGTSTVTDTVGIISFTTDAPLAIVMDASFTYDLPPVNMSTGVGFQVVNIDTTPSTILFTFSESQWSNVGEPASGALTVAESVVLPAGHSYRILYTAGISTSGGPITAFATGSGHVNFTMDLLPEPATATLLLCARPLLWHRRRR